MNYTEILGAMEKSLYDYNISEYSACFIKLVDFFEQSYLNSNGVDKAKLEAVIARIFNAYEKKDYLYVYEIAKYEFGSGALC